MIKVVLERKGLPLQKAQRKVQPHTNPTIPTITTTKMITSCAQLLVTHDPLPPPPPVKKINFYLI